MKAVKEVKVEEVYYIEYLNKEKNFRKDMIEFNSFFDACRWGATNIEKFNLDMIKYY